MVWQPTYTTFALSFAAFLCLMAIAASWSFRTSGAPLLAKLFIPVLLVIVSIETPYAVASMMGLPTTITPPEKAELVAFVAHDDDGLVDLWLNATGTPRAYEVKLTEAMKRTLREAQQQQGNGARVMLKRPVRHVGYTDQRTDAPAYEIVPDAFSLPRKD